MVFISLFVLAFRCGLDLYVNGETNFAGFSYLNKYAGNLESKGKLLAYQEQTALYSRKPSTLENDLVNSHQDMLLKKKGVSLNDLFSKLKWHQFSCASFVGGYGYMDIWASERFYRWFAILYALFGFYLIAAIIRGNKTEGLVQLATTLFASLLTIFISIHLSWVYAFQPQGRYLFPVIPMIGLFVYANRHYLNNRIVHAFLFLTFILSAYSFIFIGLARINSG